VFDFPTVFEKTMDSIGSAEHLEGVEVKAVGFIFDQNIPDAQ
jgi:hypothetical protein